MRLPRILPHIRMFWKLHTLLPSTQFFSKLSEQVGFYSPPFLCPTSSNTFPWLSPKASGKDTLYRNVRATRPGSDLLHEQSVGSTGKGGAVSTRWGWGGPGSSIQAGDELPTASGEQDSGRSQSLLQTWAGEPQLAARAESGVTWRGAPPWPQDAGKVLLQLPGKQGTQPAARNFRSDTGWCPVTDTLKQLPSMRSQRKRQEEKPPCEKPKRMTWSCCGSSNHQVRPSPLPPTLTPSRWTSCSHRRQFRSSPEPLRVKLEMMQRS